MIMYIYGGVASGKSEFAEKLITQMYDNRIYLATMENHSETAKKRIQKHLIQRAEGNFHTVEEYRDLNNVLVKSSDNVLLEDLTNLLSNNLFDKTGIKADNKKITENIFFDIIAMERKCNSLFIVGNDIFSTDKNISNEMDTFLECLYFLHKKLCKIADREIEVIYGLPCYRKVK